MGVRPGSDTAHTGPLHAGVMLIREPIFSTNHQPEDIAVKIVLCAKYDLAGNLALNRLVRALAPRHEVHVILSDYVLKQERQNPLAAFLVAHERDIPVERFFPWLDRVVPSIIGVNGRFIPGTMTRLAAECGVSLRTCGRARSPETIATIETLAPDVIISCRYDYIFPEEVLVIPRLGAYGLHPGRLPHIQGLCGPFWAMRQGHRHSGCTVFRIDAGIDSGDVIEIGWNEIDYSRSLLWNFVHTYFAGIAALLRLLPELEAGRPLEGIPQDPTLRQYYSYPSEEDFAQFIREGGQLVSSADYRELLSWYLPGGRDDPRINDLDQIIAGDVQKSASC